LDIEALWDAGLSTCFASDFARVRALFARDPNFAEMCRDFVEINALTLSGHPVDPHIRDCLSGLRAEILPHFAQAGP
jgi:hypothetical protein